MYIHGQLHVNLLLILLLITAIIIIAVRKPVASYKPTVGPKNTAVITTAQKLIFS